MYQDIIILGLLFFILGIFVYSSYKLTKQSIETERQIKELYKIPKNHRKKSRISYSEKKELKDEKRFTNT